MEMEDHRQYNTLDELFNGRPTNFQPIPPQLFSSYHRDMLPPPQQPHHHHFEMMQMVGTQIGADHPISCGLHQELPSDSTANNVGEATASGGWSGHETLTLLEIRSRLDPMFKEANQTAHLWEEISRILTEEHRYKRSGETCREKFENLYKYYKKTREVKGRSHDDKHHRFFRHLEALYGDTSSSVSLQENSFPLYSTLKCNFQRQLRGKGKGLYYEMEDEDKRVHRLPNEEVDGKTGGLDREVEKDD